MAAGAYPFLAVRPGLRHAPDHADVLPQRSAAGLRPDLQFGARGCAPAPAGRLRHGPDPARMGARLPLRHRAARPQRHADGMKLMPDKGSTKQQHLTLRRAQGARLEGWATPSLLPTLRDAGLRPAPQGEV